MTYRDPQEAGRAWIRGDLASDDYFANARREAVYGRRLAGLWQRIRQTLGRRTSRGVR